MAGTGERNGLERNLARFAKLAAETAAWLVRPPHQPMILTDEKMALFDLGMSITLEKPPTLISLDSVTLVIHERGGFKGNLSLPNGEVFPVGSHDIIDMYQAGSNEFLARRRAIEGLAPNFGLSVEMP